MSDSKLIIDLTVWENHVRRYDFEGQDNALGSVLQRAREALSASPTEEVSVPEAWKLVVQKFVDRVDAGEIHSVQTYAEFKKLLKDIN